jgi:hypothetical protein
MAGELCFAPVNLISRAKSLPILHKSKCSVNMLGSDYRSPIGYFRGVWRYFRGVWTEMPVMYLQGLKKHAYLLSHMSHVNRFVTVAYYKVKPFI